MSTLNILFYSNKCMGSQSLISLMQNEGLFKYFTPICTDDPKNIIPKEIKVTPTLFVKNIPTPYIAGDAFTWLDKMKQWKLNEQIKRMSEMQKKHSNIDDSNETKLLEYSKDEMGGISDNYAYLDFDDAIQHCYFNYENIGKENIFTAEDDVEKISATEQKKLQDNLKKERMNQEKEFKKNIDDFRKEISRR